MLKKLLQSLSPNGKLFRDIRNGNYKNWKSHIEATKVDPAKMQSLGLEIYEHHLKEVLQDYAITDSEKEVLTKIRNYFQLPDTAINSIKNKYAKAALTGLSKQKLADNVLTEEEMQEIGLLAKELNIPEEEVNRINKKNAAELYENSVRQIMSDNKVSVEEQQALKKLAQQLGINMREVDIDKKLREDYYFLALLNALEQGYLPAIKPPAITTQENEVAYWEISSNLIATRNFTSGSGKLRIKVEKGAAYKLGSSSNTPIREHVTTNNQGVFIVTSQRVVFAASQQSFSIPLTQLNSFDTYNDGIGLQKNNTELILQFYDRQMSEVVFKVLTNAINTHI